MDKQAEKEVMRLITDFAEDIRKEAVNDFAEFLKSQMKERDYMGIKYKQGVFSDSDIDYFVKQYKESKDD